MALSGIHIVAGYAGSIVSRDKSQPILGRIIWTETLITPGTTTNAAPLPSDAEGQPIFRLRCSIDAYVSIGKAPDATSSPRFFLPANTDYDVFPDSGLKLAWVPA